MFDQNSPLDTPPFLNLIDAGIPHSSVKPLSPVRPSASLLLTWSGRDDSIGSGIGSFSIFVSRDDSAFRPWLTDSKDTSALFTGIYGSRYAFYSLARDNAGNEETPKSSPDASTIITGVSAGDQAIPREYGLLQSYPNPFNPTATIGYLVPQRSMVSIQVYNTLGQLVATLIAGEREAGTHTVQWDASLVPSGVYFYRMTATGQSIDKVFKSVRKMLLVK